MHAGKERKVPKQTSGYVFLSGRKGKLRERLPSIIKFWWPGKYSTTSQLKAGHASRAHKYTARFYLPIS